VVGPTRLNYSKIVPLVDYTSKIIGKVVKWWKKIKKIFKR
jgi:transcriptional regulator of heat shock response